MTVIDICKRYNLDTTQVSLYEVTFCTASPVIFSNQINAFYCLWRGTLRYTGDLALILT